MTEPKLTDFQKKVLRHVPKHPGERSTRNIVTKVYGSGWEGWKKARGRKIAVLRALHKMLLLKLVGWNPHLLSKEWSKEYWYQKR